MAPGSDVVGLAQAGLAHLPASVGAPSYDRSALRPAIVHIGVGGFHRAHLAAYVHELCTRGRTDWAIVGAGVRPSDSAMADALRAQDHLYTMIVRGPTETSVEVIGSIVDFELADDDATALVERIAAPETQIVSMTVTEGGYPVDDSTGDYVADSPAAGPTSAFGIIAAALDQRRAAGGPPLTVMSCDNVLSNGDVARAATLGEAARFGDELVEWIDRNVSFPNSMVDRITPATTDADREWLAAEHGVLDRWPVVTEPFRQWVIEDDFAGERPPLELLDVIVTDDVAPYELMKLRLLNAGHSCLAYIASLLGHVTVDQALADDQLRAFVVKFLEREARPTVPPVAGIDLAAYTTSLVERFSNPQIGDQVARLCLDGSAKFPKFLLPTIRLQLDGDGHVALSSLALAGWCEYLVRAAGPDATYTAASDPLLAEALDRAARSTVDPLEFLAFDAVFSPDLASDPTFASAFVDGLNRIRSVGLRSAIDHALASA